MEFTSKLRGIQIPARRIARLRRRERDKSSTGIRRLPETAPGT